jgi:hypothetical protein
VLAGVLGTDKPVFDIIGDPINVAARLQTTDVPGKVQIPQSTYELILCADFKIEQRGETFLKGKGKTMTYLVSGPISSQDDPFQAPSSIRSGFGSTVGSTLAILSSSFPSGAAPRQPPASAAAPT